MQRFERDYNVNCDSSGMGLRASGKIRQWQHCRDTAFVAGRRQHRRPAVKSGSTIASTAARDCALRILKKGPCTHARQTVNTFLSYYKVLGPLGQRPKICIELFEKYLCE
jgi:hypothetical protein